MRTHEEIASALMTRMGFSDADCGPHVEKLRADVLRYVGRGLNGFHVDWSCPVTTETAEIRALAILDVEWEIEHGHCCTTEVLDCYPINRRFSTRDMRWHYEFRPDRIMPLIRDVLRRAVMHLCIWRDSALGRKNPYRLPPPSLSRGGRVT